MAPAREDSATIAALDGTDSGGLRNAESPGRAGPDGVRQPLLGDVRTRVLVSFFVLLVVSTAVSLLVLRQVLISRISNDVRETLTVQVDSLRTLTASGADPNTGQPFNGNLERIFIAFLELQRPPSDGVLATFIEGARFRAVPEEGLSAEFSELASLSEPRSAQISTSSGEVLYVAVPVEGSGRSGVLVAAELLTDERDQVESAVQLAIAVSIVVTLLASLFIWLAAGRAVQPLRALARTTRTITETDLSERVSVRGGDEIAELGRTYNDMLDRLQAAFADQKEFLADVGHELRTPITVIRGNLETLGDDPEERREATVVINDELERMSRLVDDLLLLARSDRPDFLRSEPLDLDLLTQELFAKARTLGVRRWLIDQADVGIIHADSHRLTSAVMNLAQNAVRHTRGDQAIAIGSAFRGDQVRLWVRDEGDGIEPNEQVRIFERFAGTGSRSATGHGSGLGLAIVKAIAEAHGGWVELESELGKGSTFTVVIPAAADAQTDEEGPWHGS